MVDHQSLRDSNVDCDFSWSSWKATWNLRSAVLNQGQPWSLQGRLQGRLWTSKINHLFSRSTLNSSWPTLRSTTTFMIGRFPWLTWALLLWCFQIDFVLFKCYAILRLIIWLFLMSSSTRLYILVTTYSL